MAEDLVDHRRVFEGGDDLQGTATVGAVLHVDIEDSFEQLGPAHARWFSLSLGVIGRGFGSALWRSGNDLTAQLRVGRQYTMEANEMKTRARHEGGQALHELQRLHDVWVVPSLYGLFSCSTTWPARLRLSRSLAMAGPRNVAAELLHFFTLIGAPAHRRMQA